MPNHHPLAISVLHFTCFLRSTTSVSHFDTRTDPSQVLSDPLRDGYATLLRPSLRLGEAESGERGGRGFSNGESMDGVTAMQHTLA